MENNKRWYFTFGIGHLLCDYVVVINDDYEKARSKMIEQFGRKWCDQYSEGQGKEMVEKYNYKVIEV